MYRNSLLRDQKMLNIVVNNNSIHTFTFHQHSFIHIHTCINTIHCIDITTQLPVCVVACFYGSLFLTTYLILQLDNTLVTLCNDSHTTPPIGIRQIPLCSSKLWASTAVCACACSESRGEHCWSRLEYTCTHLYIKSDRLSSG